MVKELHSSSSTEHFFFYCTSSVAPKTRYLVPFPWCNESSVFQLKINAVHSDFKWVREAQKAYSCLYLGGIFP